MFVRAYLRASTSEQDATRARAQLDAFAHERGLAIAAAYVENESGATLARPELFRLLKDCRPGDVLLIEQVDRLSRLTSSDWTKLRAEIDAKRVRIVALDLPTSWSLATPADEFTWRVIQAINGMLLNVLAAVARKDYDGRCRRQAQGQAREGRRPLQRPSRRKEAERGHAAMLKAGSPWSQIRAATGCRRSTLTRIAKRMKAAPMQDAGF